MAQPNFFVHNNNSFNPPPTISKLPSLFHKIKSAYLIWCGFYQTLPKIHRYSLGQKIDNIFIEIMAAVATASFLTPTKKPPYVETAVKKTDTLKILLMILWEAKSLENNKYLALSVKIDEIGRMLGGWKGQLAKQNSPNIKAGEK